MQTNQLMLILCLALLHLCSFTSKAQDTLVLITGYTVSAMDINGKEFSVDELLITAGQNDLEEAKKYFGKASGIELASFTVGLVSGAFAGYAVYGLIVGDDVNTNAILLAAGVGIFAIDLFYLHKRYNLNFTKGVIAYNEAMYQKRLRAKVVTETE